MEAAAADSDLPEDAAVEAALACFRQRLRATRRNRNLTQIQVAQAIGVSQSQWSKIENGQQELNLSQVLRLLRLLQLESVEQLFGPSATGRLMGVADE
jgi:transcriptional regulator with XRE-family HTH domain